MEIITMILSGLALLAAILCLILILREKKRNQKRNADYANLLRAEITACTTEITRMLREIDAESKQVHDEQMRKLDLILSALNGKLEEIDQKISDLEKGFIEEFAHINKSLEFLHKANDENTKAEKNRAKILEGLSKTTGDCLDLVNRQAQKIENLENGIVPDYNEALKAKESVDRFNEGISGILGFNPMEAAKKSRQERTYGVEVE